MTEGGNQACGALLDVTTMYLDESGCLSVIMKL